MSQPYTPQVHSTQHGFKLLWVQDVEEVKSKAYMFEHVKSGAPLLYLSCEDDNKVFSITFRTPPTDDTGISHIMEHSVLCGSEKFPSKEPFVDLLKGSLQTFLNAFTASDRTIYPVASRNDKDFRNLMNVYLDAVFFPNVVKTPEILMQEGWHYEVDEETGDLAYNGIVYNEMKGAFSSPQGMLYRVVSQCLYPDGTYGKESGGDPKAIPDLTQEMFIEFHKKFYHPSNSLIYLYGNGNIDEHLAFIDKEYLSRFDKQTVDANIVLQGAFSAPKEFIEEYSVDPDDPIEDKTFLTMNYLIGNSPDAEMHYAMNLLSYILVDSQASPLRRALLDAGLGKDVEGSWDNSILQPCFSVVVKNSNPDRQQEFVDVVEKTLRQIVEKGFDPKLVEGAINRTEFSLREFQISGFPKGLAVNMQLLDSWAYGADPLMYLRFEPILKKIKEEVPNRYFEKLVQKVLLDNTSRALVVMKPKQGLDEEKNEQVRQKLAEIKQSFTPEQLEQIKETQVALLERQAAPDKPEDVAKIPTLQREDIDPKAEEFPCRELTIAETKFLNHDVATTGIVYLSVFFDADSIPEELIPYASILSDVIGRVDTENYTYADLTSEIDIHTGGIGTGFSPISSKDSLDVFYPKFTFGTKTMIPKLDKGLDLILEMMLTSKFDDPARLKEIIQENRVGMEQRLISSGNVFAQMRAASYFSPVVAYRERIGGLTYYQFLADLEKNFDARSQELSEKLQKTAKLLFNRNAMLVSVTVSEPEFKTLESNFGAFANKVSAFEYVKKPFVFQPEQRNEAVVIPSQVQYVAKAADFKAVGGVYSGKMNVLSNVLRTGYLWNNIRVQGGAYGSGFTVDRTGLFSFMSYRDPHLQRTVDVFDGTAKFVEMLEMSDLDLTKAIIATSGSMDRPTTPAEKGARAATRYIVGISQAEIQRERDEVLATTALELRGFGEILDKAMKQNNICVFGNENKINESKPLFKNVIRINP
ncbi:MAG: insulinase family protein [Planctomycetaceae bacterium]|nr:insulinase family protein [Planctomycetaceae bacterium]